MAETHDYLWNKYGLHIIPGVVDPKGEKVTLEVQNGTDSSVDLPRNTLLAYAHAIDSLMDLSDTEEYDSQVDIGDQLMRLQERYEPKLEEMGIPFAVFPKVDCLCNTEEINGASAKLWSEMPSHLQPMLKGAARILNYG